MHLRYSLVLLLLTALYGQTAAPTPAFEDYPVAARWRGKPAAVKFDSKGLPDSDPRAREIVELAAEDGPNFAGRFTLARWGCATGCFRMVVIDAPTGRVFRDMPFATLDIGYDRDSEEHKYGGLSFRAASSLLVAEGCFDNETHDKPDCGRRYYRWDGGKFVLLHSMAVE
jgi:hypothetical protein